MIIAQLQSPENPFHLSHQAWAYHHIVIFISSKMNLFSGWEIRGRKLQFKSRHTHSTYLYLYFTVPLGKTENN